MKKPRYISRRPGKSGLIRTDKIESPRSAGRRGAGNRAGICSWLVACAAVSLAASPQTCRASQLVQCAAGDGVRSSPSTSTAEGDSTVAVRITGHASSAPPPPLVQAPIPAPAPTTKPPRRTTLQPTQTGDSIYLDKDDLATLCSLGSRGAYGVIVARNTSVGGRIEFFARTGPGWQSLWQSSALPKITALASGSREGSQTGPAKAHLCAVAAGGQIFLLREATAPPRFALALVGNSGQEVHQLGLIPSSSRAMGLLALTGGTVSGERLLRGQMLAWTAPRSGVAPPHISEPHAVKNVRPQHHPWNFTAGDIDGDGRWEVLVNVWKRTRASPENANRPFLYQYRTANLWPQWLGSSLGYPYQNAVLSDVDGDGKCELIAVVQSGGRNAAKNLPRGVANTAYGRWLLVFYTWNGFGFAPIQTVVLPSRPLDLSTTHVGPLQGTGLLVSFAEPNGQFVAFYHWSDGRPKLVWRSSMATHVRLLGLSGTVESSPAGQRTPAGSVDVISAVYSADGRLVSSRVSARMAVPARTVSADGHDYRITGSGGGANPRRGKVHQCPESEIHPPLPHSAKRAGIEEAPSPRRSPGAVSLLFAGDVMLGRGVSKYIHQYGPRFPFLRVQDLVGAVDIAFCNLESPACAAPIDSRLRYSNRWLFRAQPRSLRGLQWAGFDVVSTANNHSLDCGEVGLAQTQRNIAAAGMRSLGDAFTQSKTPSRILTRAGLRVGYVAFSEVQSSLTTEAMKRVVVREIKSLHQRSDVVVASFHWGREYRDQADERQRQLARTAVDAGADIVVGHHPHVHQPLEYYKGRPILYSLGNFVFDQQRDKHREGVVLVAQATKAGISDVRIYPVAIYGGQVRFNKTENQEKNR